MKFSSLFILIFVLIYSTTEGQNIPKQTKPIDPANMDISVKPCDNFFQYANGAWLKNNPIPAAYNQWGSFNILAEQNNEILKSILEDAETDKSAPIGSNKRKVGDFYAVGLDSAGIEALGIKPIAGDLEKIEAIKDLKDVKAEITRLHSFGINVLFAFGSEQDPKNSTEVIGEVHHS